MRRATSAQRAPQRSRGNVVSSLQLDAHGARTAAFSMSRLDADQSRNSCFATNPGAAGSPAEMRTAGCNRPLAGQSKLSTKIVSDSDGYGKAEASMQARAAQAGCGLFRLADGEFLLTKWGMAKSCPDLRSVSALLNRLAGTT